MLFRTPGKRLLLTENEISMPSSDDSWHANDAEVWLVAHQNDNHILKMDLNSVCDTIIGVRYSLFPR